MSNQVQSFEFNPILNFFQALLRGGAQKNLPDLEVFAGTGVFDSGAMSSVKSISFGFRVVRQGKVVTIEVGTSTFDNSIAGGAPNTSPNMATSLAIVPVGWRPSVGITSTSVRARDNGDNAGYRGTVNTDGTLTITPAGFSNWTTTAQIGFFTYSQSWTIP